MKFSTVSTVLFGTVALACGMLFTHLSGNALPSVFAQAQQPELVQITLEERQRLDLAVKDRTIAAMELSGAEKDIRIKHAFGADVLFDPGSAQFYRLPKPAETNKKEDPPKEKK